MAQELTPVRVDRNESTRNRTPFVEAARALATEMGSTANAAGEEPAAGELWAAAGELVEVGLGDDEAAEGCYGRAVAHPRGPAAAFAGLRRLARRNDESALVGDLYRLETEAARTGEQLVRAAAQRAIWLLHQGADRGFSSVAAQLEDAECTDAWAQWLALLVRGDLASLAGESDAAAELAESRFGLARSLLDEEDPAQRRELATLAASLAMVHRYLTARPSEAALWLERTLELSASELALRELAGIRLDASQIEAYAERLADFAATAPTTAARARALFELGHLRSHRLADPAGARDAFRQGMREGEVGAAAALPLLRLVRNGDTPPDPRELVDALGLQAELAATPRERAECFFQMGLLFDAELHLPDAAVDILREALAICPGHRPAARALGRLYQRRGAWDLLAELLEDEVNRYPDSRRTRLKLIEVYQDRLAAPHRAEPHLRAILAQELFAPAQQRFNRLLGEQGRWLELHEHLVSCAHREPDRREALYDLERAAEIAEGRLNRPDLAVESWRTVHDLDPLHPGALAALGRLYHRLGRWEDLIALNEDEIAVRDEPEVGSRLWTKNGEIYEQRLNDEERAQQCYELALEIAPTYEPALEALGRLLWRSRDWDGLMDMYEAEIAACRDPQRKQRRMLDLGELQATLAGRYSQALATFETVIENDPVCEEALLWIERLHQLKGDSAGLLATLQRRLELVPAESCAALHLRAGCLAEWSLGQLDCAWDHYIGALAQPVPRSHAVPALLRLGPRVAADAARREAAMAAIEPLVVGEDDPTIQALLVLLMRRLEGGRAVLADWLAVYDLQGDEVTIDGAVEAAASTVGDMARLSALRSGTRLSALWALLAAVDEEEGEAAIPRWLPNSPVAADVLSELDVESDSLPGGPVSYEGAAEEGTERPSPTLFRRLVRRWAAGQPLPRISVAAASVPLLRLHAFKSALEGDLDEASRYAELEARGWQNLPIRQRRLSQAAEWRHSAKPGTARSLFVDALDCNCYDQPSRQQVYAALERCQELEILCDGLADHVGHTSDPAEQAKWLERLAAIRERVGDRESAVQAWQAVLERKPLSAVAMLELLRLLTLEGRLDEARASLERALRRPFQGKDRLDLLGRVADLNLMEGGDGTRAVAALEESTDLANRAPDWLRRLARAHYAHGSPDRAMHLLSESLPAAVSEADLGDWFLLARVKYLKLNDVEGSRELLWGLFEQFPQHIEALRELEAFYRKQGGAAELAERLATLLIDPPGHLDRDTRAFLWEYVGDLNYQVLRRNRDAEIAYEGAIGAAGSCARLSLKVARSVGQQAGKGREACARFVGALRQPGIGVVEWIEAVDDLEALFEGVEDAARVRVMRQIRDLLQGKTEPDADEARVKRDPARPIERDLTLVRLVDGLLGPGSLEVMQAIAPAFERSFGHRRARKRSLGGRRLKAGEAPVLTATLDLAAQALGISAPRLFTGLGSDQPEWLKDGGLWVPEMLLDTTGELGQRFWAGHAAGLAAFDIGSLALAQPGEVEQVLHAIRRIEADGASAEEDAVTRAISGSRFSNQRARVMEVLESHPEVLSRAEHEAWYNVPAAVADRLGLLLCGDVRAACDAVLGLEDDQHRRSRGERLVGELRTRQLLEYAISHAYQELRYLAGLAGKPKVL